MKNQHSYLRNSKRNMDIRLILGMCLTLLLLAGLACNFQSETSSDSLNATKVALDVEATSLAREKEASTQEPESQLATLPPPTESAPAPTLEPEQSPTQQPSDTPAQPTSSPTTDVGDAVEGSLVRAPYDPAANWGTGHDYDPFDASTGLFSDSSGGAANAWRADGRFNITFTSRGRWTWYWSFINGGNFYADTVIVNGDNCVSADSAGMVFRGNNTEDYGLMFGITCGGSYFLGFTAIPGVDGIICTFEPAGIDCSKRSLIHSNLIQSGPGAINRIGVLAKGSDLDFYINGQWVANRSVALYSPTFDQGMFALYLGTAQKPDASVSFEEFSVWYLD
ncbi:MAG: hypothetical protein GTO18_12190 [Anaerolineales bacterium]|nr:hypothetical protein [Anaerolineales bacterium]